MSCKNSILQLSYNFIQTLFSPPSLIVSFGTEAAGMTASTLSKKKKRCQAFIY